MFIKTVSTALLLYSLSERLGLFRAQPATIREVLNSYPFMVAATLLSVALVWNVLSRCTASRSDRIVRGFIVAGLVLIPAGLWASYFLHFQATAIRMERQDFLALPGEYEEFSVRKGPRAKTSSIGLYINHIDFRKVPLLGTPLPEVDVRYISNTAKSLVTTTISPLKPLFSDWTMVRISGVGYSVAYAINDQTKREIDRTYIPLKLFPPGSEDFFSPKDLGYYWHLRYYPDYVDENGKASSRSLEPKNPMFGVRVVRNKDIIFNGLLSLSNTLQIERVLFNIKDVRPCVEITFIRDPGIPVLLSGLFLTLAGLLAQILYRRKHVADA